MDLPKTQLLGVGVTTASRDRILEAIGQALSGHSPTGRNETITIVTPNSEQIMLAERDLRFRELINRADIAIPDGIGVVWGLKKLANVSVSRLSGIDFMDDLITLAAQNQYSVAFLGGKTGVAVKTLECYRDRFPTLTGWAEELGEIDITEKNSQYQILNSKSNDHKFHEVAEKIVKKGTRMVFVALGAPKQELVIDQLIQLLPPEKTVLFMPVGGAFDMIVGTLPRAPHVIRTLSMEWLWRLILEPHRVRRQLTLLQYVRTVMVGQ